MVGEKLTLQLEHKNGIGNDNRLHNLCFLCPNCHSQTDTWGGKNIKKIFTCQKCDVTLTNKRKFCKSCALQRPSKFEVTKEELEKFVNEMPITHVAKHFNISDSTVRSKCKKLEITIPKFPWGYWLLKK